MTERTAYKLSEVQAALGISRSTMWRWIRDGKIEVIKFGCRSFVKREHLREILSEARPVSRPIFKRETE